MYLCVTSTTSRLFQFVQLDCTMWAKYPGTKFMGTGVQVGKENDKFNVACSRSLEFVKFQVKRTGRAIVFAH